MGRFSLPLGSSSGDTPGIVGPGAVTVADTGRGRKSQEANNMLEGSEGEEGGRTTGLGRWLCASPFAQPEFTPN